MNVWSFFSVLIWQALLGAALWHFRKPLARLLDRIKTVKAPFLEIALDELHELELEIAPEAEALPMREPSVDLLRRVQEEVAASPRRAILDAWQEVYIALRYLVWKRKQETPPGPYRTLGRLIRREQLLDDDVCDVVDQLKNIYKTIDKLPDLPITSGEAEQYVRTASMALAKIAQASRA